MSLKKRDFILKQTFTYPSLKQKHMKPNAPHPLECLPSSPLLDTSLLMAVVPILNIREC